MIAALDFVGEDQLQKLRVVEFFLAGIGPAVGQRGQDAGESQAFQHALQFRLDLHEGLLQQKRNAGRGGETSAGAPTAVRRWAAVHFAIPAPVRECAELHRRPASRNQELVGKPSLDELRRIVRPSAAASVPGADGSGGTYRSEAYR